MADIEVLDLKKTESVMACVLEHYLKHYDIVLKKLSHARDATKQSIKELDEISLNNEDSSDSDEDRVIVEAYDGMWDTVITQFRDAGATEEDLLKIEAVLEKIPRLIKKYYDTLVEQDALLQEIIKEIQAPKYAEAMKITKKIQGGTDMLSGLEPDEFELPDSVKAFIIAPPQLRDTHH